MIFKHEQINGVISCCNEYVHVVIHYVATLVYKYYNYNKIVMSVCVCV